MCAVRFIARVFPPGHESYLRLFEYLHVDYGRLPVTFSSNHDNARLPDPDCLCFTECVARVADMSGAAGAVDELKHDVEKEGSTPDRSPAHLLDQLLASPATIPEAVQRAVVFYRRVLAQVISTVKRSQPTRVDENCLNRTRTWDQIANYTKRILLRLGLTGSTGGMRSGVVPTCGRGFV